MQEFYIKKGSVNPVLRMTVFQDGRYDFKRSLINNALQGSTVTFSMRDVETNQLKIAKQPAEIVLAKTDSCEEQYLLQYKWKPREVKNEGTYQGWFEITFNDSLIEDGVDYPKGNLIVPILEDLLIIIK